MGEIDDNLTPSENDRLADAAPLGRSVSTMSDEQLNNYAGAAYKAFNLLEARMDAEDSGGTGFLDDLLDARLIVKLVEADPDNGRSKSRISDVELVDFAGALYAGLEDLAARAGALEGGPAGTELEDRLEDGDNAKLAEAAPLGRSKTTMSATELTEWAGATSAAYDALDARMTAIESAT